jgi:hypothetical protein
MAKSKKKHGKTPFSVSLAVIGGLAVYGSNIYYLGARNEGLAGATRIAVAGLTGYDTYDKKWHMNHLSMGMVPIALGVVAHRVASMLGVNRMIARAGIPFVRI